MSREPWFAALESDHVSRTPGPLPGSREGAVAESDVSAAKTRQRAVTNPKKAGDGLPASRRNPARVGGKS
jgi:hypothetical protein